MVKHTKSGGKWQAKLQHSHLHMQSAVAQSSWRVRFEPCTDSPALWWNERWGLPRAIEIPISSLEPWKIQILRCMDAFLGNGERSKDMRHLSPSTRDLGVVFDPLPVGLFFRCPFSALKMVWRLQRR